MIQYDKIRRLHIEISTKCNSTCPDCPRNLRGVEILENQDFPLTELYLDDVKKILPPDFVSQLRIVHFNGNLGDFITARDALEIVEYLRSCNPSLQIDISTNASARPRIWEPLARLDTRVQFRLDGLKDTHHLYRQNTDWNLILSNAEKYIAAGGYAIWTMIVFDHNRHQIQACRELSEKMGFRQFDLIDNDPGIRNTFPVFTRDRRLSHVVGDYRGTTDFDELYQEYQQSQIEVDRELGYSADRKKITCKTMTIFDKELGQEIYIAANGEISPCCWTGFYPAYKSDYTNQQLRKIVKENNALVYGIRHSIQWFERLADTWQNATVRDGKILVCNNMCGHDD